MFSNARPRNLDLREYEYKPLKRRNSRSLGSSLNSGRTVAAKDAEIASLKSSLWEVKAEYEKLQGEYAILFAKEKEERWHKGLLRMELDRLRAEWAMFPQKSILFHALHPCPKLTHPVIKIFESAEPEPSRILFEVFFLFLLTPSFKNLILSSSYTKQSSSG